MYITKNICHSLGAAPISPEILNVLRAAFGAHVIEGYGQTECSAACSGTLPGDHTGTVGAPLVCNEIRLDDVPEMNYSGGLECKTIWYYF